MEMSAKERQVSTLCLLGCPGRPGSQLISLFILVALSSSALQNQPPTSRPDRQSLGRSALVSSNSSLSSLSSLSAPVEETDDVPLQPDPLARLSRVFGISRIPRKEFHRSPPQYMQDLYASVTDSGGLTKSSGPYNSNVIRSFPDKDSTHKLHFRYNISYLEPGERILQSEFHVFKMRPAPTQSQEPQPPHVILIKIYQVLDIREMYSTRSQELLEARRVSSLSHGWYVFNVTGAVRNWHSGSAANYGFLVTTESTTGVHVNGSYVRFAQRNEHHDSKQPILVVFMDNGQMRHPNYISPSDEEYSEIKEDILRREWNKQHRTTENFRGAVRMLNEKDRNGQTHSRSGRRKRNAKSRATDRKKRTYDSVRYRNNRRSCTRYEMFVDFEEIGWSGWIISPNSYNAYHCAGECPFPLGQSQKPTNHATVQSIVHALGVGKNVGTPCCVPNKLYSISLLYFDDNENVILKQYDDMVVASCGCH